MSPQAQPDPADICSECHRLYDPATRQIVEGCKNAKWIKAGPGLCASCRDITIDQMQKAIPVEGGGS